MARGVWNLAAGEGVNIVVGDGIRIAIEPVVGATVTYSLVKGPEAVAHGPATTDVTVRTTIDVDGPYYYISTAAEAAVVYLV